jgi:hypothetical protein
MNNKRKKSSAVVDLVSDSEDEKYVDLNGFNIPSHKKTKLDNPTP